MLRHSLNGVQFSSVVQVTLSGNKMEEISEKLFKACLRYVKRDDVLQNIRRKCDSYLHSKEKMCNFAIPIDLHDLLDSDSDMGNLVLNRPLGACKIFHKAVFAMIMSESLLPQCIEATTVSVSLRLNSFPTLPSYQINTVFDLRKFSKSGSLAQFRGIITGMSMVEKYTKSARFMCSSPECEGAHGDKFIRCHIPGAPEHQTVRDDFLCSYCGRCLTEDVSQRILGEKCIIEAVDKKAFDSFHGKFKYQSILCVLRDDLIKTIHIGSWVSVVGLSVFYADQQLFVLEVNNVQDIEDVHQYLECRMAKELDGSCLDLRGPLKILYEDRKESPWSFGLSVAFGFGDSVVPPGTYLNLKLGMLLSLLSKQEQPSGVSILAVGSDDLQMKRLLSYGARFSVRCLIHAAANHLSAFATRDRFSNYKFLEGGSLLLAGDGICVLPDLGCWKKAMKETILQVFETGLLPINLQPLPCTIPASLDQPAPHISLPCQCKIWSYLDCSSTKHQNFMTKFTSSASPFPVNDANKMLINLFSLVFAVDSSPEDDVAQKLMSNEVLCSAMGCQSEPLFQDDDLKEFLWCASKLEVSLNIEAQKLIQDYYLASRRVRDSESMGGQIPRTAVLTISSLTEAHAKLNLRIEAGACDAVMAILLFEEALLNKTGTSVLDVRPLVHANHQHLSKIIGPERDMQLLNFHQQLKRFLRNYAPDLEE